MKMIPMRTYVSVVLPVMVGVVALPTATYAQTNVGCLSAANERGRIYRDGYGAKVSLTDEASARNRSTLGLPNIPNEQVTIVSDTTTCRIASMAYDSAVGSYALSEPPLVLKIGTEGYVVVKGFETQGGGQHFRMNVLFKQDLTVAKTRIWY
jgi:hypothetical protein